MLIPTLLRWCGRPLAQQFEAAAKAPALAQQSLLQKSLTRHQTSAFGIAHGFSQIYTAADYRQAVPIQDYEALRPYVQRMMQGEANVLVSDPVQMFTLTSGTTGQPKYIPVTAFSAARNARLMRQWLYRLQVDHPRCFRGAMVGIVSPAVEGHTANGIPYGSLTGRIYRELPWLMRRAYAIPYPVFEIEDYDARYWAITRYALARQASFLCTPNPSTLLRLAGVMADRADSLIRAIHDGTLAGAEQGLTPEQKEQLRPRPQPQRARELEQIANATGTLQPKDCWPDLQVIGCWTGGSVGVQAQRLVSAYGTVPIRDAGYLASEARVTLPIEDGTPSGVLDLTLNYYEFIPEGAVDEADPPVYLSHELEVGQRYSILLTTPGGLYRYHINDIVEVTGFYHQAPLLAFVRKGKDMSSLTGEKLHANQILAAMDRVQQQLGIELAAFQWVADVERMGYRLYLEWPEEQAAWQEDSWIQQTLLPALDRSLANLNGEYAQKRDSGRLRPLCGYRMRPGWAEAVKREAIVTNSRDVQYKWPVLCPELQSDSVTASYQQAVLPQASTPSQHLPFSHDHKLTYLRKYANIKP
ncbi:MAG: GH3 auxin-responsive promoter family protein [Cyanobacteria bacterium J06621_3]